MAGTLDEHDIVAVPEPPDMLLDERLHDKYAELVATTRVTVPVKPLSGEIVMVDVPTTPVVTVTLAGFTETVKLGGAVTLNVTVAE